MRIRARALTISGAVFLVALCLHLAGGPAFAQKGKDQKPKLSKEQNAEGQALLKATDDVVAGKPGPAELAVQWTNSFLKAQQGRTYIPFTLTIQPDQVSAQSLAMYLRVVKRGGETPVVPASNDEGKNGAGKKDQQKDQKDQKDQKLPDYAFENIYFPALTKPAEAGQPYRVSRAFTVMAGDYDVYLAIQEWPFKDKKTPGKLTVLKQAITVPDYNGAELTTSTVFLIAKVDPLQAPPTTDQLMEEKPYAFTGRNDFQLAWDRKFTKTAEFSFFYQVYNESVDQNNKPDLLMEYVFYKKGEGQEKDKPFVKTESQTWNAQNLPADWTPNAGYQLPGGFSVPLTTFAPGEYRLEIKVTDKLTNKSITRDASFTVTGGA